MDAFFSKWLIVRSGFRQHRGDDECNGCVQIGRDLATLYSGPSQRVELGAWDNDPEDTADYIYRWSGGDSPPQVMLVGYSWGAGYGVVQLAKQLRERNIRVQHAVLCDPVKHSVAVWRAMIPRTIFHHIQITIPSNIESVYWLRQYEDKPAGHDLVAESPYTKIHAPYILKCGHVEADNDPAFYEMCLNVARRFFEQEP